MVMVMLENTIFGALTKEREILVQNWNIAQQILERLRQRPREPIRPDVFQMDVAWGDNLQDQPATA